MIRHPGLLLVIVWRAALAGDPVDEPLTVGGKAAFHARQTFGVGFVAQMAAYAGVLHWMDTPREWGQGSASYGKRVVSASGATAIRNVFAFCLDAPLGEDPRYRRSGHGNLFVRVGHAARAIAVTRTDSRKQRVATWRIGSAMGAAYLSNVWYPDRLNTFSSGMEQGAATLGLDLLGNIGAEFWPDIRNKLLRRH